MKLMELIQDISSESLEINEFQSTDISTEKAKEPSQVTSKYNHCLRFK